MKYEQLQYTRDDILLILLRHLEKTTDELKWNEYVSNLKKQLLPPSNVIMEKLNVSKWEDVKNIIEYNWTVHPLFKENVGTDEKKDILSLAYNKMLLIKQVEPYKEHVSSTLSYNTFRKEHNELELPHFQSVIKIFGSWNEFKSALGLETHSIGRRPIYTDEELLKVLKEHREYFINQKTWNEHADKEQLPRFSVMKNRLPLDIIQRYTNYAKRYGYSQSQLIDVVKTHKEQLKLGKNNWERYAAIHKLPQYNTLIERLGHKTIEKVMNGEL